MCGRHIPSPSEGTFWAFARSTPLHRCTAAPRAPTAGQSHPRLPVGQTSTGARVRTEYPVRPVSFQIWAAHLPRPLLMRAIIGPGGRWMQASGISSLNYCRLVTRHHITTLPIFVIWPLSSVLAYRSFGRYRCVSPCCMSRTFGLVESIGLVALATFLLSLAAHPARSVSSIPHYPGRYSVHILQIPMCFMTHSYFPL